jgi:hypothetical protein
MAQNFISWDRDQQLLMPPDLHDWLPTTTDPSQSGTRVLGSFHHMGLRDLSAAGDCRARGSGAGKQLGARRQLDPRAPLTRTRSSS